MRSICEHARRLESSQRGPRRPDLELRSEFEDSADPQKNGSCITLGDGRHPGLATGKGNSSCGEWSFSGPAHSDAGALQSGGKCLAVVAYSERPPPSVSIFEFMLMNFLPGPVCDFCVI